jgi:hypothetical protein
MQENNSNEHGENKSLKKTKMDKSCVFINSTERKFICLDVKATEEYTFIEVGKSYKEAILDVEGNYNQLPQHCVLLLIHGQPFYIKKEYLSRYDKDGDETRSIVCGGLIFIN